MSVSEAEKHVKEARKALKPSPLSFRFRPDKDLAAVEFSEAAKIYYALGKYEEAYGCHKECAQLKQANYDHFGSGRAWEAAANMCESNPKKLQECVECLEAAQKEYRGAGKLETAIRVLQKIAKINEENLSNLDAAKEAFDEAFVAYDEDDDKDNSHNAVEVCRAYGEFLSRHEFHKEMLGVLKRQIRYHAKLGQASSIAGCALSQVVLRLQLDDVVGAKRDLEDAASAESSVVSSKQYSAGIKAIDLYHRGDSEEFRKLVTSQTFVFLPVPIAKICRKLDIPESMKRSAAATKAADDENDDDNGSQKQSSSAAEMML